MRRIRYVLGTLVALCALVVAPSPASASGRPDAVIRMPGESAPLGNGVYNSTAAHQTILRQIGRTAQAVYYVELQNDGRLPGDLRVRGGAHTVRFRVRYYVGSQDVTRLVKAGALILRDVEPGAHRTVTVRISTRRAVPKGTTF